MKKIYFKIYKLLLCFIIAVSIFSFNFIININTVKGDWENSYIIDDTTDSIIVVLDESISEINKVHNKEWFSGVEIQSIKDLTKMKNPQKSQDKIFRQILQIFLKDTTPETIVKVMERLSQLDGIRSVEPNTPIKATTVSEEIPINDPRANDLWGLFDENGINISQAWKFTTGSPQIRVGIIDSGIATHPDLNHNLTSGWDYYNANEITHDDPSSHGTHIAGTIGATANNLEGIVGINWNVTIVPLQVQNTDNGLLNIIPSAISAITDAKSFYGTENQIDVINYSVAGFGESLAVREAVREYPGLFVWSAGNKDSDIDELINQNGSFDLPNIISVGAIDKNGKRPTAEEWGYNNGNPQGSNYSLSGINVNIYAPGNRILSTIANNGYGNKSGTSMAAPHVTGVAALLLSYNPNLTAAQLKTAILNGADPHQIEVPDSDEDEDDLPDKQEVKKLNAAKALQYVMDNYGSNTNIGCYSKAFSKSINASSDYFEESNYMLRLNVQDEYSYNFSLSSTSALDVTLYDSNLNEIAISTTSANGGCTIDFDKYLTEGKYYLQTSYVSETATGTVSLTIACEHTHSYTHRYIKSNATYHKAYCACGEFQLKPHVVRVGISGADSTCALCGMALSPIGGLNSIQATASYVTLNGSFIAQNGIIYLVDADWDAYFAGTLQFYLNTNLPIVTNRVSIYGEGLL